MKSFERLAERVNGSSDKTVEGILEIGLAFLDAHTELSASEFSNFLSLTQYKEGSSMIRKYRQIGEANTKLRPLIGLLPPVFTTVYRIATMPINQLSELLEQGAINRTVSTKNLENILKPVQSKKSSAKIKISFGETIGLDELRMVINSLNTLKTQNVVVFLNDAAQDIANNFAASGSF